MSSVVRWDSQEGWLDWINESASGRLPRLIGSALKLPFSRIAHIGTGTQSSEHIARWSWGQRQRTEFNQPYLLEADLLNDDDTLNPIVGGNLGHTTTIDGSVELSEFGFNSINRNSNLNVSGFADFQYPDAASAAYMGCWIKSHLVDYSSGFAIIAASHTLASDETVYWGIGIDVDNKIKGFTGGSGVIDWITPVGGDVTIDGTWHYIFFAVGLKNTDERSQLFVVDNDWGQPVIGHHNQGTQANVGVRFGIGSCPVESSYGFSGIIDELVVSKWTGGIRNRRIIDDPVTEIGKSIIEPTDLMANYTEGHRFDSNVFLSTVIDTEREDSLFTGIYADYENPNGSSVQFSFRASDTTFEQDSTSPEWTGFTAPNRVLHGTAIGHEDLGIWLRGRYQQVRMKLNPSSAASPLQLDTPVINAVEISTGVSTKVLGATRSAYEPGTILGQVVNYDAAKDIDKVSMNLTINTEDRQTFVVGQDGHVAFQAANWQESRNDWVFQPIPNWTGFEFTITGDPRSEHTRFDTCCSEINRLVGGPGAFHITNGDEDLTIPQNRAAIDSNFGSDAIWYPIIGNHEAETGEDMEWLRNEYDNGNIRLVFSIGHCITAKPGMRIC